MDPREIATLFAWEACFREPTRARVWLLSEISRNKGDAARAADLDASNDTLPVESRLVRFAELASVVQSGGWDSKTPGQRALGDAVTEGLGRYARRRSGRGSPQ